MANSNKSYQSCGNSCSLVFFGVMLIVAGTVNDVAPLNVFGWICLIAAAVIFYNKRSKEERLKRQEAAAVLLARKRKAIRESEDKLIEIQQQPLDQRFNIIHTEQVQMPGRIDDPSLLAPLEGDQPEYEEVIEEPISEPVPLLPTSAHAIPETEALIEPKQTEPKPPEPIAPPSSVLVPAKPSSYIASPKPETKTGAPTSRFGQPATSTPVAKPTPPAPETKPEQAPNPAPSPQPEAKPVLKATPPVGSPLTERESSPVSVETGISSGFNYKPKMINSRFGKPLDQPTEQDQPDATAGM